MISFSSCSKDESNPFIGTWERTSSDDYGTYITIVSFTENTISMKSIEKSIGGDEQVETSTASYTYTDDEITVKSNGEEQTNKYKIKGDKLIIYYGKDENKSPVTFTKK